ncbi:MAG: hypothetical protein ACP5VP_08135 [Candidatus Limnocylindrales bacterium]
MTEILTESYCERCGAKFTFESRAAGRGPISRARIVARGLRNYLTSDSSLDEALAEARREHERHASGAQLQAFHQTFNFCFSCREYVCADCWNEAAGRCRTCAPLPGVPDPLDLRAPQAALDRLETAPVAPVPAAPVVAALAETGIPPQATPTPTLEAPMADVLGWPAEDQPARAASGEGGAEAGGAEGPGAGAETVGAEPPGAVAPVVEGAAAFHSVAAAAPEALREPAAELRAEPTPAAAPEALPEPAAETLIRLAPELEHPSEALPAPERAAAPPPQPVPATEIAAAPRVSAEDVAETAPPGQPVGEPVSSAMSVEAPTAAATEGLPASPAALPETPRAVPEVPGTAPRPPQPAAPATTPWQVIAPDEVPARPAPGPSQSAQPLAARQAGAGSSMGWLLRRRESAQSQVSSRITQNVWEASTRDLVTRPGTGIQACQSCGLPLSANARFCRRCGARQG